MGTAEILLLIRTKCSVIKADRTQIGRNHLASRDHLRGSPLYIGEILSGCQEIRGNSKERVEGQDTPLLRSIKELVATQQFILTLYLMPR